MIKRLHTIFQKQPILCFVFPTILRLSSQNISSLTNLALHDLYTFLSSHVMVLKAMSFINKAIKPIQGKQTFDA